MNLYLDSALANHRHGRFFVSQLDAVPADERPNTGLLLMHGKAFQELNQQEQETWWQWVCQPGCALVLVPPFASGAVCGRLDWQITLRESTAKSNDGAIPCILAAEVNLSLDGNDGEFNRVLGHQWADYSVNTRYFKQHHGTGVFAATCLPLWSISLLDYAQETLEWLESLLEMAGTAVAGDAAATEAKGIELEPTDYTLMVCMQAWGLHTLEEVSDALSQKGASLLSIPESDMIEGMARLSVLGLVNDAGLTEIGRGLLDESPYAPYVERLKEEASYERK
nr:hypothetical protein [uncultured Halomonas sp.]